MQPQRTCLTCGTEFTPAHGNVRRGFGIYCSRKCYGLAKRVPFTGQVAATCEYCGIAFIGRPSYPSQSATRYCSKACVHAAQARAAQETRLSRYFWPRITKTETCWLWVGPADPDGYGRVQFGKDRIVLAHRLAYELASGEALSSSDIIGHTCDTPSCTRNDEQGVYEVEGVIIPRFGHLFKGTTADNNKDAAAKGRTARGVRHKTALYPETILRGADHPNAKVTAEIVRAIRASSESGPVLATRFGINRATVNRIRRGEAWGHLK